MALYALMQFLFSPILGALSDRFGRRPVLLVSLAGVAADYLLMAAAPSLLWLYIGRIIAGITGANMAVASAYATDLTYPSDRAKIFDKLGAVFGMGFIAGPVLGGLLGKWHTRAPFLTAALMNGINLIMAMSLLAESKRVNKANDKHQRQSTFTRLAYLISQRGIAAFAWCVSHYYIGFPVSCLSVGTLRTGSIWLEHLYRRYVARRLWLVLFPCAGLRYRSDGKVGGGT